MYGWRGRLGILVPSVNVVVEPEAVLMAPEGVAVHSARMGLESSEELVGVDDLHRNAKSAIRDLAAAHVGAVGFACTLASFNAGEDAEARLVDDLQRIGGSPVVSAIGAVIEAFDALGVRRVAMATPYSDRVNQLEAAFLRAKGLDVVAMSGLGVRDTAKIAFLDRETIFGAARGIVRAGAEVLFISCTNLPTATLISTLEVDTRLPVVTSNQALMWALARRIGVSGIDARFGRLMGCQVPASVPALAEATA